MTAPTDDVLDALESSRLHRDHPARLLWSPSAIISRVTDAVSSPATGRLNILLEEYRALRSEVNQRIGASATLVGFVAAGAAFVTSSKVGRLSWVAAAVVGFLVLIVWASNLSMLGRLGKRLHRLEMLINEAAREAYGISHDDSLLEWDSYLARSGGWMRALAVRLGLYNPSPAR